MYSSKLDRGQKNEPYPVHLGYYIPKRGMNRLGSQLPQSQHGRIHLVSHQIHLELIQRLISLETYSIAILLQLGLLPNPDHCQGNHKLLINP